MYKFFTLILPLYGVDIHNNDYIYTYLWQWVTGSNTHQHEWVMIRRKLYCGRAVHYRHIRWSCGNNQPIMSTTITRTVNYDTNNKNTVLQLYFQSNTHQHEWVMIRRKLYCGRAVHYRHIRWSCGNNQPIVSTTITCTVNYDTNNKNTVL